jgi:hypothetical protein
MKEISQNNQERYKSFNFEIKDIMRSQLRNSLIIFRHYKCEETSQAEMIGNGM